MLYPSMCLALFEQPVCKGPKYVSCKKNKYIGKKCILMHHIACLNGNLCSDSESNANIFMIIYNAPSTYYIDLCTRIVPLWFIYVPFNLAFTNGE